MLVQMRAMYVIALLLDKMLTTSTVPSMLQHATLANTTCESLVQLAANMCVMHAAAKASAWHCFFPMRFHEICLHPATREPAFMLLYTCIRLDELRHESLLQEIPRYGSEVLCDQTVSSPTTFNPPLAITTVIAVSEAILAHTAMPDWPLLIVQLLVQAGFFERLHHVLQASNTFHYSQPPPTSGN
jgi:hypothetical protein